MISSSFYRLDAQRMVQSPCSTALSSKSYPSAPLNMLWLCAEYPDLCIQQPPSCPACAMQTSLMPCCWTARAPALCRTGIIFALFLNTMGGAFDNAKKMVETGVHGGKGSETHKATVTGAPAQLNALVSIPIMPCHMTHHCMMLLQETL